MPFTPFHFGPAVILKAALSAKFSAVAFVSTQVAIDSEVLWHIFRHQSPMHGILHTAACATCLGLGVGAAVHYCGNWSATLNPARTRQSIHAEWNWTGVLMGGGLGGATHHGWGTGMRNAFGLWQGNTALLKDTKTRHPDEASMVIIEAVWERLNADKRFRE